MGVASSPDWAWGMGQARFLSAGVGLRKDRYLPENERRQVTLKRGSVCKRGWSNLGL